MADLFDLFDDEPAAPPKRQAEPAIRQPQARAPTSEPPAPVKPARAPEPAADAGSDVAGYNAAAACRLPRDAAPYKCRVGGGGAMFSDDGNRTHFCGLHAPWGFFPHQRGTARGQP